MIRNQAYGREGFELQRDLCKTFMSAVKHAGMEPDSIIKEYGPNQYEVVVGPDEELRAADAACPHPSLLSPEALKERGYNRLPTSLESALNRFECSSVATSWFPETFVPVCRAHKTGEINHLADMDIAARCAAYEDTY